MHGVEAQDEESVGRLVYEDLVNLTFLAGCGLALPTLMGRFLKTLRPQIPARGLWLFDQRGLVALSVVNAEEMEPAQPDLHWRGMVAEQVDDDRLVISLLPEVVLVCRLDPDATPQRASDVLALSARILALAWQAESVAIAGIQEANYRRALDLFRKQWLRALLERHQGNIKACAQASGLSRMAIYGLMRRLDVQARDPEALEQP